jgi:hypothetical protein
MEGPYSSGLVDPLTNLVHFQLERGDPGDAIDSLRRAIQLIRINDGLHSPNQLPLLRRLIALYRQESAYGLLGDAYSYYYRVSGLGTEPLTADRIDAALEYLDWERELYASRQDGAQRHHLLRAYEANRSMLKAAENAEREVYLRLAMSQLRNLYLILGDRPMELSMAEAANREKKLAAIQRMAYSKGLALLQECIVRSDEASLEQLAEIHLELGDWQQWNGKLRSAREQYAKVVELMERAGDDEQLAQWFDQPVELPDEDGLWQAIHKQTDDVPHVIEASYEVNSLGESRRVRVTVNDESAEGQASKIRAMLRDTHFRPRIGKDGPESGPRVTRYYQLVGN